MLLAASLLLLCATFAPGDPVRVSSAHYDIEWSGTQAEADDAARLADRAFDELVIFFGGKPTERLKVRVFADEEARVAAAWNDGVTIPVQHRYASFAERTRTAYVARVHGHGATRTRLLYALCLQFHSLAKAKNIDAQRTWSGLGIAQDFGRSTWDGRKLVAFATPRVEAVELPKPALDALVETTLDLRQLEAVGGVEPALMWGVAALCLHGPERSYRKAFEKYALGTTGSKMSTEDFLRTLGPAKEFANDLYEYLVAAQVPFQAYGDWRDDGAEGLVGSIESPLIGYCVLRESATRLSARASALPKQGGRLGFVAGWSSRDDCVQIDIEAPEINLYITRAGEVTRSWRLAIPGDASRERRIVLEKVDGQYVLSVDDSKYPNLDLPDGRMGFLVGGATVNFRDVEWR